MAKMHTASQGDSTPSIAYENGHFPTKVWNHPKNEDLRREREDMNVLFPGDEVWVPDVEPKTETRGCEQRHRFRRRGVPEVLKIRLLNEDGDPRSGEPYRIIIDGKAIEGSTDGDGMITQPIPPNASRGTLFMGEDEEEEYQLNVGHLDPPYTETGARARLTQLGFLDDHRAKDEKYTGALLAFQRSEDLEETGELNEPTWSALSDRHGV